MKYHKNREVGKWNEDMLLELIVIIIILDSCSIGTVCHLIVNDR